MNMKGKKIEKKFFLCGNDKDIIMMKIVYVIITRIFDMIKYPGKTMKKKLLLFGEHKDKWNNQRHIIYDIYYFIFCV